MMKAECGLRRAQARQSVKAEMGSVKAEVGSVKTEVGSVKAEVGSRNAEVRMKVSYRFYFKNNMLKKRKIKCIFRM